ncbi:MAG: hypothetical protein J5667_05555 [Bacteroidales bacterium]|nr:hypothetical protein [Bacteroidales bacterium]
MKKIALFFSALCACLLFSCTQELATPQEPEISPEPGMQTVTITASIAETKTSYAESGSDLIFSWTAGDEISVYCSDNNFYTFTANSTAATTTFTGVVPDGVTLGSRAFFPADANHDLHDYKYHIPESKDLTSHPSAEIPMIGNKGEGNAYSFTHCCGATKLTLINIPSKFVSVQISMSHPSLKLSGTFGVFTDEGFWRWNPTGASTDSEKIFSRKVVVSDHTASIYVPYASGSDWWGNNTISVIGYDSLDNPTTLISSKTMGSSIGTIARAHVKPLTPLPLVNLLDVDWTDDVAIPLFTVSYGGSSMRILDWKGTSDDYYIYLWYRINKSKIAYDDTLLTYDSSDASYIYIGFDYIDAAGASAGGGIQGSVWDARAFVRPFTGTTKGTIEFKDGYDASSYVQKPVSTTLSGVKVYTTGYIVGSDAFVAIAIPRSSLGSPSSGTEVDVQCAMNYYYTDTGTITLK